MQTQRKYNVKDVDMLITASTILETAIAHKAFLQQNRSTWADPFFDNLKQRIDTAMQVNLGSDNAKTLRLASQAVYAIQKKAITDLALVKVQITEDFRKDPQRRTEILKQLGFTANLQKARTKDQEALITLLYMFKENLPGLRTEIESRGTDKNLLQAIVDHADTLKNSNVSQETFKGSKRTITADSINEFNDIYEAVISISRIATKFFGDKPHMKDQFSFSKVSKALNIRPANVQPPQAA